MVNEAIRTISSFFFFCYEKCLSVQKASNLKVKDCHRLRSFYVLPKTIACCFLFAYFCFCWLVLVEVQLEIVLIASFTILLATILNLLSCIYSFQWFWQKKACYVNLRHTYFNDSYFTSQLTNSFFFGTTSVTVFGAYMWSKSLNFFFGETDHKFKRTIFKAASILKETIFQKIGVHAGHMTSNRCAQAIYIDGLGVKSFMGVHSRLGCEYTGLQAPIFLGF